MLRQAVVASGETASTPERWAETFAASSVLTEARRAQMRQTPEYQLVREFVPPSSTVLDAGCGFGEWVELLSEDGYDAAGLDYSPELIARLRGAYPDRRWVHGDIRNMPIADGSYDAVVSWGVIEHDEAGPRAALKEFQRVVRPGGTIIVTVPIDSESQRRASPVFYPERDGTAFFQYAMTTDELAHECEAEGFEVVSRGTIPGAALAMMAPRLFAWTERGGRLARIVGGIGRRIASRFQRYHLMTYCVARRLK